LLSVDDTPAFSIARDLHLTERPTFGVLQNQPGKVEYSSRFTTEK